MHGAGQRRDVDEMRRAELLRVPERIAEDQPAFGVGVDDFHGLAAGAANDVARPRRAAARHVLGRRNDADHAARRVEQLQRAQRRGHSRAAGHVVFHALHAVGRLDRDSARVERDALPDEAQHRRRRRARGS